MPPSTVGRNFSIENGGSVRADHIHVGVAPEFTLSALHQVVQGTVRAPLTLATASERDRRKDSEVRGNDFALSRASVYCLPTPWPEGQLTRVQKIDSNSIGKDRIDRTPLIWWSMRPGQSGSS